MLWKLFLTARLREQSDNIKEVYGVDRAAAWGTMK